MFGLSKKEQAAEAARKMAERQSWVGRFMVGSKTVETKMEWVGTAVMAVPVKTEMISGIVKAVGEHTICIDGEWFELNHQVPCGLRIIEVHPANVRPIKKVSNG